MKAIKQYSNILLLSMLFMFTIFTTGCKDDSVIVAPEVTAAPVIVSTTPSIGDTNVTINTSVAAFFDKELDATTVNTTTFTLKSGATSVAGAVSYANNAMVFNPTVDLNISTEYNATITTGVKDLSGNAMVSEYVWNFTTGTVTDATAPTVTSTDPLDVATGVPYNRSVSAIFSETLDPTTVTTTTFTLKNGTTAVAGVVSYESNTMIFNPTADLAQSTEYNATITTGVKDLAGIALAVNKVWSFTTGTTAVTSLAPVNLGTAGGFVILDKTGISTTGTTAITGDIGVSPAAQSYITGFSETLDSTNTFATSSLVTGKIYAADMAAPTPSNMTTAVSDMEIAYTDAAGRTTPDFTELGAGDVSGMTLAPGLYKWGTGLLITNVGVTISGGATDVWIFQISGDLTLNNGAIVTLAGGALAKNIFWQVAGGTGVTFGTTADFKGIVLAQKGIVVNNGATVKGRLLAQTAVTLDANAVTQP
ncbi:ice-binding family protein [Sulfurimonas sp. CS5]|uniref:ice-binding family protein n=1 Tax=Sulfurimonas sp. CS5 TaxID=3391145 RepID=UPI0039EBFB32